MPHVFASKALLPNGWADDVRIELRAGVFGDVAAASRPQSGDVRVGCAIPGLCNAHSHAFQRALAGHTEQRSPAGRDNFWSWRERMYALAANVGAVELRAIAAQAYSEMLASGFTSVVEFHYLHRDPHTGECDERMYEALAGAATDSGIRLIYVPVHYERAGFNDPEPSSAQASFALPIDAFLQHHDRVVARQDDQVVVGIGAHSLRAVSPESLQAIAARANAGRLPMHLHIAEQLREVDQCLAAYGRRPVRWLLENVDVRSNWNLVHATHMDEEEINALAASKAVAVLCPSTEANLGDGLFPLHSFLKSGGNIAIGSDSHISINPYEELRWLEYGQRLVSRTRNIVSFRDSHVGSELFERALAGGASASGQMHAGLRTGAPADLVVLDEEDPMFIGHDDTSRLDALIFSGYPLPLERVMARGEWQVVDAAHRRQESLRADYSSALQRLRGKP